MFISSVKMISDQNMWYNLYVVITHNAKIQVYQKKTFQGFVVHEQDLDEASPTAVTDYLRQMLFAHTKMELPFPVVKELCQNGFILHDRILLVMTFFSI